MSEFGERGFQPSRVERVDVPDGACDKGHITKKVLDEAVADLEQMCKDGRGIDLDHPCLVSIAIPIGGDKVYPIYDWAPIDTAPRDGTVFHVAACPGSGGPLQQSWVTTVGKFDGAGELICPEGLDWCGGFKWETLRFTHWMPLPAGPGKGADDDDS